MSLGLGLGPVFRVWYTVNISVRFMVGVEFGLPNLDLELFIFHFSMWDTFFESFKVLGGSLKFKAESSCGGLRVVPTLTRRSNSDSQISCIKLKDSQFFDAKPVPHLNFHP